MSTGQRSFAFHGPSVWNSLPATLRDSSLSMIVSKGRRKTYLFGRDYLALLGRFLMVTQSIQTYLLTYLKKLYHDAVTIQC